MPLRNPNDSEQISQVLSAIQTIALPNTYQQSVSGSVLVNDDTLIDQGGVTWPVLFIQEAGADTKRLAYYTWKKGSLHVRLSLLNIWQSQANTIATLWTQSGTDLYRMQANLEDNPRLGLTSGNPDPTGTPNAEKIVSLKVSNRLEDALDEKTYSFSVVKRWLDIELSLKPYNSGR